MPWYSVSLFYPPFPELVSLKEYSISGQTDDLTVVIGLLLLTLMSITT